jgi:CubicO group peptidase (beta-lactamase class C family)
MHEDARLLHARPRRALFRIALLVAALAALASSPAAHAAAASPAVLMNRYLHTEARAGEFSGSVLVALHGTILLSKGYNLANTRRHVKNTAATQFGMTGETDTFTAGAILELRDQGKLALGDSVCLYLADCPAAWQPMTIEDLLIHSSGLFDPLNDDPSFSFEHPVSVAQMLIEDKAHALYFHPGTAFTYSTQDYILLGLIIERAAGVAYADYLQSTIFARLAMAGSGVPQAGTPSPPLARPYTGKTLGPRISRDISWESPGGTMYSTVEDLFRWDQALTGGTVLSSTSVAAMFGTHHTFPDGTGLGYGWFIGDAQGHRVYASGGSFPGLRSINDIYPDDGLVIIVLDNQSNDDLRTVVDVLERLALNM